MSEKMDITKFSELLKIKRGKKGLRAAAQEIKDVSASTLSRIEQGNVPDLDTFLKICKWLNRDPKEFVISSSKKKETKNSNIHQEIGLLLRADKTLSPDTVDALVKMVEVAYDAVAKGKIK